MFETLCDLLERRISGLLAVYAFGSRARGDAQRESDFDLAVLATSPLDPQRRWQLQQELAVAAGADVDLVDLRRASTVMRMQILKDARVLFDGDPTARQLFEATALSAYARLNEERRWILADIAARGNIYG
jgi:predicted nucleotidyltransferase